MTGLFCFYCGSLVILMWKRRSSQTREVHTHQHSRHIVGEYFCCQGEGGGHGGGKANRVDGPHYKAQRDEGGSCRGPVQQSGRKEGGEVGVGVSVVLTGVSKRSCSCTCERHFLMPPKRRL